MSFGLIFSGAGAGCNKPKSRLKLDVSAHHDRPQITADAERSLSESSNFLNNYFCHPLPTLIFKRSMSIKIRLTFIIV